MDLSPNMKQYVGLLEVVCSSSPIPTAEVLQDVSVLYARLGKDFEISLSVQWLALYDSHMYLLLMPQLSAAHNEI